MQDNITQRFNSIYELNKPLLEEYEQKTSVQTIEEVFSRISSNQTTVMVCGEFKKGKSSFINALLKEEVCPTDEHIATSTVSIIRYGDTRKVLRTYEVEDGIKTETVNFNSLIQYAKGTNLSIGNTLLLEIEIPCERLKDGLTLIDTPGVGGLNPQHRFLTLSALSKADALFYVVAVGEPVTTIELEFFKNDIIPNAKHYKVILNKIDLIDADEIENSISDCKKKFMKECCCGDVDVVPVSAYLWQEYNKTEDDDDKEFSMCEGLENALNEICNEYRKSLHPLLKDVMLNSLNELRNNINFQKSQVVDPNPDKIKKLNSQRSELQLLISDLKQDKSDVKIKIDSILKEVQTEVLNDITKGNILLSSEKLNGILNDSRASSDDGEKWVLNQVNKAFKDLLSSIDEKIEQGFIKVRKLLKSNIYIEHSVMTCELTPRKLDILPSSERGMSDVFMSITKNMLPAVGVGSLVSFVATPLGVIAGAAFLYKALKEETKTRKVVEIRQYISPRISTMCTDLQSYVMKRFDDFRAATIHHFEAKAKEMSSQLEKVHADYQKCQVDSISINNYKKELDARVKKVENSIGQLQLLLTNPFCK